MAENNFDWAIPSDSIPLSQMNNPIEENERRDHVQNQFDHDDGGCFSKIKCLLAACFQGKKRDLDLERGSIENDRGDGWPEWFKQQITSTSNSTSFWNHFEVILTSF